VLGIEPWLPIPPAGRQLASLASTIVQTRQDRIQRNAAPIPVTVNFADDVPWLSLVFHAEVMTRKREIHYRFLRRLSDPKVTLLYGIIYCCLYMMLIPCSRVFFTRDMSRSQKDFERYFRFPLVALAFDPDPITTLQTIVNWCVVDVGTRSSTHYEEEGLHQSVINASPETYRRLRPKTREEYLVIRGAGILLVKLNFGCSTVIAGHERLQDFIENNPGKASKNTVTITPDWMSSCIHTLRRDPCPRTLSWREFRVLCALLSNPGGRLLREGRYEQRYNWHWCHAPRSDPDQRSNTDNIGPP